MLADYASSIRDYNRFLMGLSADSSEYIEANKELKDAIQAQLLAEARGKDSIHPRERKPAFASAFGKGTNSGPKDSRGAPKANFAQDPSWGSKWRDQHTNGFGGANFSSNVPFQCRKRPKTYYEMLGLHSNASDREIRSAFRKLALKHHPDKNKDPASEDVFKELTTAYSVLSDKASRKEYDLTALLQHV